MKKAKKFLISLLAFASVSAFTLGLTGCDDKKPSAGIGTGNGTTIGGGLGGLGGLGGGSSDDDNTEQGGSVGNNNNTEQGGGNTGDDDGEQGGNVHTHVFNQEVVADEYLKSAATCTSATVYHKSCECGEKGTDTFTYGNALEHVYDQEVAEYEYLKFAATCESVAVYHKSCECGAKGTEMFEYGEPLEHVYNQEVVADEYLETAATCTNVAIYYKSCECGAKGTDIDIFAYGEPLEHVYNQEVVADKYLETAATCESVAVYHKSCECGAKGAETFEYGEPLEHVYNKEVVADEYLETAASCTSVAIYHKSCKCGAKGADTFRYGDFVHTWKDGYHYNSSSHWIQCKYCTATKEYGQHVPDDNGGFYCKTCRHLIGVNEGIVYGESEDGTYAEVWGYNEGITTEIVIESQYNNLPVKGIYGDAFRLSNIVSVVIPDSITLIRYSAFSNCYNLTSITFTGTVAEWNAIEKGSNWNYNVPATKVVCSDGEVAL
ncbi:MAG: leucine-rich repeat protein [Clostridia bacterium]|nr:leucine-rich repeat protein [Clostridia bacterium]